MNLMTRAVLSSLAVLACGSAAAEARPASRTEITAADVPSLVGKKSKDLSVLGFHLGMSRAEAEKILQPSKKIMEVKDEHNPDRLYVYSRLPDGEKGKCLLYLIWEKDLYDKNPDEPTKVVPDLQHITVFQDFRPFLKPNFRRLLTMEAVDENSAFKKRFIGYSNRSKVTLDIESIGLKHVTYFYDDIGLEVTHKHSKEAEGVVFSLSQK